MLEKFQSSNSIIDVSYVFKEVLLFSLGNEHSDVLKRQRLRIN
jgi:hypothetical protein